MASGLKPSCTGCGHLPVCIVFRTISPAVKQLFPEPQKPLFNAEDLGQICQGYVNRSVMEMSCHPAEQEAQV